MTLYDPRNFSETSGRLPVLSQLIDWTQAWWARRQMRAERRSAIKYIAEMPDWQLKDIGLNRGDVARLMNRHGATPSRAQSDPRRLHL